MEINPVLSFRSAGRVLAVLGSGAGGKQALPAKPASARKVAVDRHMAGLEAPRHADAIGDRRKIEASAEAPAPGALAVYR
jgi:hypothetical protein